MSVCPKVLAALHLNPVWGIPNLTGAGAGTGCSIEGGIVRLIRRLRACETLTLF